MSQSLSERGVRWWFAGLFLLLAHPATGATVVSSWYARSWQTDEGLPDNIVAGVAQTKDGYLWVATFSGLARFDGLRFREFAAASAAGVPSSTFNAMLLDRHDRLWLAKNNGIVVCIAAGQMQVFSPEDRSPVPQRARDMAEDSAGGIWVAYDNEQVFRISEGRMRALTQADGLPVGGMCQLVTDKDGQLWFVKDGHLGVFRGSALVTLRKLENSLVRIAATRSGGVWVAWGGELWKFVEGGSFSKRGELPAGQSRELPSVLREDRSGAVWYGTRLAGLFRFDGSQFASVTTSHYEVWSVTEDTEGSVWVGTRGGGLIRLRPRVVELQDVISGEAIEAVSSVCEDTEGTLWATAGSGLLARNSGNGWELMSSNSDWSVPRVLCAAANPGGGLWLGTRMNGLYACRPGFRRNLRKSDGLASDYVRSLLTTESGDVWIGTDSPSALQRLRAGKLRTFDLAGGIQRISAMALDANGDFWASTYDGHLLRVRGDLITDETPKALSLPREFRCLCATSDGSLWIGCAGQGILRLKDGKLTEFRTEQGLHENYIAQIVEDPHGRMWFAGNRGIFFVKRSALEAVAEGRAARVWSVVYGRDQGLPALQPNKAYWPGALRSRDGRVWIPMLTGLAAIDTGNFKAGPNAPPVVIERVTANGTVVATHDFGHYSSVSNSAARLAFRAAEPVLRLPAGQRTVEIEFTALSYAAPETLAFKYRLEGLDKDWVDAGTRRTAIYPQIPPGEYRFRVIASNHEGVWNETGAALTLIEAPYYWETLWFRVVAILSVAGLLAGAVSAGLRRRYRRKLDRLEQQRELERERTRIAQDLHDDLGAGLVEISFGSELAQDPALSETEAREHAREIGARAREMVTALDEIVWAVNPKHDDVSSLASYFCQFAQHFLKPARVRCHLEIAKDLPVVPLNAEQRHSLFMAFKEALCNLTQHSGATEMWLGIFARDGSLVISVRDNGCGLDLNARRARAGADGLGNMQQRLQRLGGNCELISSPGQGMTVSFMIALNSRNSRSAR